ncbi:MAG TPA: acetate kinase [Gemmatimonadaceae bacterium]|nr:acetate kinase [Gemmatimonadaceae bacterium]
MNVLVLNVGSSTVKFQLVDTDQEAIAESRDRRLAKGQIERIGGEAVLTFQAGDAQQSLTTATIRNHAEAVTHIIGWLTSDESKVPLHAAADIAAVGHRVVHGGERFRRSTLVDDKVWRDLEALIDLAPLHNPHNLRGITAARVALGPGIPQVAVFDTAFHQTIPETGYLYGIPYQFYRRYKVRRYGFHGTSYRYIAYRYRQLSGKSREDTNVIAMHLGNGASACAIVGGESRETSMGFTPLEGLIMGTRSGDLDPAILDFLGAKEGLTAREVELMLNKQSGLLGVSGLTSDMRELLAEEAANGDRRARLAIDLFCHRARKYIGAYLATMNGADALLFSGGIGENSPDVRARIVADMSWLGIVADPAKNASLTAGKEGRFDAEGSRVQLWVVPTDEELLIARDTWRVVTGAELRY